MNHVEIFEHGTVVFWVGREWMSHNFCVKYGLIDQQFASECTVDYLMPRDDRIIYCADYPAGIAWNDFIATFKFHKLPKGWSWDTHLYRIENKEPSVYDELKKYPITAEGIQSAYHDGVLVIPNCQRFNHIDKNITKDGYQVVMRSADYGEDTRTGETVSTYKLHRDYASALAEAKAIDAEYKRQAALSDRDWSIEQIDKALATWRHMTSPSESAYANVRSRLLAMPNVEDLIVRYGLSGVEWKYDRNTRWNTISPDVE